MSLASAPAGSSWHTRTYNFKRSVSLLFPGEAMLEGVVGAGQRAAKWRYSRSAKVEKQSGPSTQ